MTTVKWPLLIRDSQHLARDALSVIPPEITIDDFCAASAMGERWLRSTLDVIDSLGASQFQRDADALAATVLAKPRGISMSELYRAHRRLKKRDFD